jgi:hypothetical protein
VQLGAFVTTTGNGRNTTLRAGCPCSRRARTAWEPHIGRRETIRWLMASRKPCGKAEVKVVGGMQRHEGVAINGAIPERQKFLPPSENARVGC